MSLLKNLVIHFGIVYTVNFFFCITFKFLSIAVLVILVTDFWPPFKFRAHGNASLSSPSSW